MKTDDDSYSQPQLLLTCHYMFILTEEQESTLSELYNPFPTTNIVFIPSVPVQSAPEHFNFHLFANKNLIVMSSTGTTTAKGSMMWVQTLVSLYAFMKTWKKFSFSHNSCDSSNFNKWR